MNELQRKVFEAAQVRVPAAWLERLAGLARAGAAESNDDQDMVLAVSAEQYLTDARLLVETVGRIRPGRLFVIGKSPSVAYRYQGRLAHILSREDSGEEAAEGGLWKVNVVDYDQKVINTISVWPKELGQEVPAEGDRLRLVFTGVEGKACGLRYGFNEWEVLVHWDNTGKPLGWYKLHNIEVVAKEYGNEQ